MNDYGYKHQQLRDHWRSRIRRNEQPPCSRCGHPVLSKDLWDLDHTEDGTAYLGPAHMACNRAAGARKRNRMYSKKKTPSRQNPNTRNW